MQTLNKNSLYKTLDNINQIYFDGKNLTQTEKRQAAKWITDRRGLKGAYAGMFAPTENDFKGIKLFTGDSLTSKASIAHILGEESLRVLYLMKVTDKEINSSIKKASESIYNLTRKNFELGNYPEGFFCCGKCTVAYWRNINAEDRKKNENLLKNGIKILSKLRDGKGKWNRFPFFYTLLALSEIDLPESKYEMKYASGLLEKYIKRIPGDTFAKRKKKIAVKVLELI